jgi:hypothetical protein
MFDRCDAGFKVSCRDIGKITDDERKIIAERAGQRTVLCSNEGNREGCQTFQECIDCDEDHTAQAAHHAMVVAGYRIEQVGDAERKHLFLVLNSWRHLPVFAVSAPALAFCQRVSTMGQLHFATEVKAPTGVDMREGLN